MADYKVIFYCDKDKNTATVEKTDGTFKCPHCAQTLIYLPGQHKLGGHGKTEKTVGHSLRSATEL